MVAPSDPKGINRIGSPRSLDHKIDSWGYVHGRQERLRVFIGLGVAFAVIVALVAAFLLYRFGTDNFHEVSENAFRSRQLDGPAFQHYIREHNIDTVIRLVGVEDSNRATYEEESVAVKEAGAKLVVTKLATSRLPYRSELSDLFAALDAIGPGERVLFHCSHGSDRAGLVSAIWLHDYRGVPFDEARKQLAFVPYGHVPFGDASDIGRFVDMYAEFRKANPGVSIKEWVKLHYFEEKPGREVAHWYDGVQYAPQG